MNATVRAQLPLDPPLPAPATPPPATGPVPVIDPPVPGQGDPVREPPTAEPSPITPWMATVRTRSAMLRYKPHAQAPALAGGGLRASAGAARC